LSTLYIQSVDIHQYTHQIGEYYKEFQAIFQEYHNFLEIKITDLEETIKSVQESMEILQYPEITRLQINSVLETIRTTTAIDNETGANIQTLLIHSWALREAYENASDLLLYNLSANIADGGGCVAGIAARLIATYTHFLVATLRKMAIRHTPSLNSAYQAEEEDMALTLSEESWLEEIFLELQYNEILSYSNALSKEPEESKECEAVQTIHDEQLKP
ncbi:MAG: hypothetical protein RLZ35_728, partial [Pseudomonadota bacterium]